MSEIDPREVAVEEVEFDDTTGDFDEEEIEVTDNDEDDVSDTPSSPPRAVQKPSKKGKAPATPSGASSSHGKVNPSSAVKSLKLRSPTSVEEDTGSSLNPTKNPFPAYGGWTKEDLSKIGIVFPVLTGKNETTNELTRDNKPEARYWKAPVVFKYGNFSSDTIRFDNVDIPFHTGSGYGSNYVYLCLPGHAAEAFAVAGKKIAPTRVNENSLVPDSERWWKIANKVEASFGVIAKATKMFHVKKLEPIMVGTSAGVKSSVVLRFYCKAATTEKEQLKPTTVRTLAVEVVRGYISDMDVNAQLPTRVNREKVKVEPVASAKDIATDSVLARLSAIGL